MESRYAAKPAVLFGETKGALGFGHHRVTHELESEHHEVDPVRHRTGQRDRVGFQTQSACEFEITQPVQALPLITLMTPDIRITGAWS